MAHDDIRVEAKCRVENDLAFGLAHNGGQPTGLACVHEKKDDIVAIDQLLQLLVVCARLGLVYDWMTEHRDREDVTLSLDSWVDQLQCCCCAGGLGCAALKAVLKFE